MRPHFSDLPLEYLGPRECFISRKPVLVSTVLGSCLAVTIFDPVLYVGGVCHAFLPRAGDYPHKDDTSCMFVDKALERLFERFVATGSQCKQLEIKVFGGASNVGAVSSRLLPESTRQGVGSKNIAVAEAELAARNMPIAARDVGGNYGRKVLFLTHTGGVWVKRLGAGAGSGGVAP